jgi:broad specificity phosphatase PhoE
VKTWTFLFARHGATKLNEHGDTSADRVRGWKDVPLDDRGIAEANSIAKQLASKPINVIFTSNLERAHVTAKIISETRARPVAVIPLQALRPWNLGYLAGAAIKEALPIIEHFACDRPAEAIKDGESFHDFTSRFFGGMSSIAGFAEGNQNLLLVAHHRNERLLHAWKDNGFPADFKIKISTFLQRGAPPGSVQQFTTPLTEPIEQQ